MFDAIQQSYSQMQPGDKMVMHLTKAPAPKPEYQLPGSGVPSAAGAPPAPAAPAPPPMPAGPMAGLPPGPAGPPPMGAGPTSPDARAAMIQALQSRFAGA